MKPSSFKSKSCIFGIGDSLLLILFKSLKSEMKQTVPFLLGVINVGAAHSELFLYFETPLFTNLLISVFRVSSWIFGIENGLAW